MRALPLGTLMLVAAAACGASAPTLATISASAIPSASASRHAAAAANETIDAATLTTPASAASVEPGAIGPTSEPNASATASACNEHPPQHFLVRRHFFTADPGGTERAVQYRTAQPGYFQR